MSSPRSTSPSFAAKLWLLSAALLLTATARAQTAHYGGIQSTVATGENYQGVAVDTSGNLYLAGATSILKRTLSNGTYTTSTLVSGIIPPSQIAIDPAGNLYVTSITNGILQKYTVSTGTYAPIASSLGHPRGVVLDSAGNIFVADELGNQVYKFTFSSGSYIQSVAIPSTAGLSTPRGLALDTAGNLYIADYGNNRIVKATKAGNAYTVATLIDGLTLPSALALDPNGNFAVLQGNTLLFETLSGGTYTPTTLATNFFLPTAVAFDSAGAIYVADSGNNRIQKQTRSTLDFGSVAIGATSPTQTIDFVFDTAGSLNNSTPIQALTMGAGNLDFTATATAGTCLSGVAYAVGDTCTVVVSMTPKFAGARNGAIVLNSSSGASAATAYITGTGLGPQVTFPPVQTSITGGFASPYLIAVDGTGNIYIPDPLNNQVVKETLSGGAYTPTTIAVGLRQPRGVAVDGAGNVYIADTNNFRVLKETLSGGNYVQSVLPFSSVQPAGVAIDSYGNIYVVDLSSGTTSKATFNGSSYAISTIDAPGGITEGIAVDSSGNVYLTSFNQNVVYKETPNGNTYIRSTLPLTFGLPVGIATDSINNLYVVNVFDSTITKVSPANGTSSITLSGQKEPYGVAIDASGNIYVSDMGNDCVLAETVTTPPSLNFGSTPVGTTSTPQSVSLTNLGNQPLIFSVPNSGQNPDTHTPFVLQATSATTCPVVSAGGATASLTANTSCTLSYVETPVGPGSFSAFSIFTDNNLNVAGSQQKIPLSGSAVLGTQTITFPQPPSPIVYVAGEKVTLNATSSAGLPVSYGISGPTTISGSTLTLTGPGTITVTSKSNGNGDYAPAANVIRTIEVQAADPPTSFVQAMTNVGSSSSPQAVTLEFSAATTLNATIGAAVQVLTLGAPNLDFNYAPGGTCIAGATYINHQTCTVNVVFSPRFPGVRYGGVILSDTAGNNVASTYLQATGTGPRATFSPASTTNIPESNTEDFQGFAIDGNGNIYVANFNKIAKLTFSNGTYTKTDFYVPPPNDFSYFFSVAIDGNGAVYFLDAFNSRIIKETPSGGSYIQSIIPLPSSSQLVRIAVDGFGNLYVVDELANLVLKVTPSGGTYTTTVLASGFAVPLGVAVDADGNVYVAENQTGNIFKETPSGGTYTQSLIATHPAHRISDLAIDASGNFYATWAGLIKGTRSEDSYTITTVSELGQPSRISIDSAGNVYGAGYANNIHILRLNTATPSGLIFPIQAAGVTSSPKTISVINAGNAPLIFPTPSAGLNPSTASNFTLETNANTTCPIIAGGGTPGTLAANTACTLSYIFTPFVSGDITGTSVLTDNNLNVAGSTQAIPLSGHANQGTQTISFQPPSPIAYFAVETLTLTGTTSSNLPITYTLNSGPATIVGSTLTINGTGTIQVTATQPGTADFTAAAPVSASITVTAVPAGSYPTSDTNVGSSAAPQLVTIRFLSAAILNSTLTTAIQTLTQGAPNLDFTYAPGGTCTPGVAYAVNQTCTVNIVFSPKGPGTRYGAVVLNDASGNAVATTYLHGTGIGPLLVFPPTPKSIASGFTQPMGIAVDGNGNAYISDFPPPFGSAPSHVYKQTLSGGVYTQTAIDSGKLDPEGLAVDGAGNVYIAYYSIGLVVKETLSNGAYIESTLLSDPTSFPKSIAVDGDGNLFIAEAGPKRILKETLSNGTYTQSTITTLTDPMYGIAVDALDNVYLTQPTVGKVLKESLSNGIYSESTIASGLAFTEGVAVDGVGNVYIANLAQILKLTPSNGTYIRSTIIEDADNINALGIAIGGDGNLYIINRPNGVAQLLQLAVTTPPVLTFPDTPAGSTSAAQVITASNIGNAPLTFRVPPTDTNPSSVSPFSFQNTYTTCPILTPSSATVTLPAFTSCTFGFTFTPDAPGSVARTSILKDDSLNDSTAKQFISLLGTGTTQAAQSITFPQLPSSLAFFDGETLTLSATSDSGLPVAYTVTGPATLADSTLTITGTGTIQITATQAGNAYFFAATPAVQTVSVVTVPTAVSIPDTSVGSSSPTQTITLQFPTATTLNTSVASAIHVLTQGAPNLDFTLASGGTCTPGQTYAANQACTINVIFTPRFAGTRYGAVTLINNLGNSAASTYLQGTGLGPQIAFSSPIARETAFTVSPYLNNIALDGNGNVYVADFPNNRVLKETPSGGIYVESTIGTGLSNPRGVTVDGSGNVYISDAGNHRVLKETLFAGTFIQTLVVDNIDFPTGMAVDGTGNLYIVDQLNSQVFKETVSGNGYLQSTIGTGLHYPTSVAVDGSGNVYIADRANSRILKETLSSGVYTQSTIDSDVAYPFAVAVDGTGNLYVADTGNARLIKETPSNGSYIRIIVDTNLTEPAGLAMDGAGKVYITDTDGSSIGHILLDDFATPPTLSFPSTATGATSASQLVTVSNDGNQPLTFAVPGTGINPRTSTNFTLDTTTTTCPIVAAGSTAATLAPLTSCTLSYAFAPAVTGPLTGASILTDNNLNTAGATQTISLSGTATQGTQTGQTITFPPPTQVRYPGTATLAATASSGLAVSYTLVSGPATLVGNTLTYTGTGAVVVRATQAGNVTYAAAPAMQITLNVTLAQATITWQPATLKIYTGTALDSTVLNASSSIPSTIVYSVYLLPSGTPFPVNAATILPAGSYGLTATITPTDSTNFAITSISLLYTVQNMNVFVANQVGNMSSFYNNGTIQTNATTGGGVGAAVDPAGNVWSINSHGAGLSKFTNLGAFTASYTGPGTGPGTALAVDGQGKIWMTNGDNTITAFTSDGAPVAATPYANAANLNAPASLTVDAAGSLWIANSGSDTVTEIIGVAAPTTPTTTAVTNGTPAAQP